MTRQRTTKRRKLECFVAAPRFVDIAPIRKILTERGIKPVIPGLSPTTASTFVGSVTEAIQKSDFVLGLLPSGSPSESVYYELGAAMALRKRLLIVLDPDAKGLPPGMEGLTYVRARMSEPTAITFALDQLLPKLESLSPVPSGVAQKTQPLGPLADQFIRRLRQLEQHSDMRGLSELMLEAFKAGGIEVHASTGLSDARADFALWADELNAWVGNPLLVEVRSDVAGPQALDLIEQQLARYLSQTSARWILLLYMRGPHPPPVPKLGERRFILPMRAHDLLEDMRSRSLGQIIREARNRAVHGTGSW